MFLSNQSQGLPNLREVQDMRAGVIGVVLICVMSIFLFPGVSGPFPATHGPATALRASRYALIVNLCIAIAAGLILEFGCPPTRGEAGAAYRANAGPPESAGVPTLGAVLLC